MRESCNCGAFIAAFNPREVKRWRTNHIHEGRPDPEPERNGASAQVEHAGDRHWEVNEGPDIPVVVAKIGFAPN